MTLSVRPITRAAAPASCRDPNGSSKMNAPTVAATSGSMFTNAPATSGTTRAWPYA
jgi:hypothetical protein